MQIEFEPGDARNPENFSPRRKWAITIFASVFTLLSCTIFLLADFIHLPMPLIIAFAAATYNIGFQSMLKDLNCTDYQATIGLTVYTLGFAIVPLVTASCSEEFGRQPLYAVSVIGFTLMYMMVAL